MPVEVYGVLAVPLVTGLVEVVKRMGLPKKYAPIPALAFGVGAGYLLSPDDWRKLVVWGLAIGLSAIGLYSGPKNVVEGLSKPQA